MKVHLCAAYLEQLDTEAFSGLSRLQDISNSSLCESTNQRFAVTCKGDFPFPFQVQNDSYFEQKDAIRKGMKESVDESEKLASKAEEAELESLKHDVAFVHVVVLLHALGTIILLAMTTQLGIKPILRAADSIRTDNPIPEIGALEFRYLALAYNKMYDRNKSSLENLNYKVCHDELTGAYNRAGYDIFMENLDLPTYSRLNL